MKLLLPVFLFFSLALFGSSSDVKLESILSHLSDSNGNNQELTLDENMHGGKILKLSNGTMWEVAPQDVQITEIWIFPFPLKLEKSTNSTYPYYLINTRSKTKVLVRPLSAAEQSKVMQPSPQEQTQQQIPQPTPYPPSQENTQQQPLPPIPTPTPLDH